MGRDGQITAENILEAVIESYGGTSRTPFHKGCCCVFGDTNFFMRNLALRNNVSVEKFGSDINNPMVVLVHTIERISTMEYKPVQSETERSVALQLTKCSLKVSEKASETASTKNSMCQKATKPFLVV